MPRSHWLPVIAAVGIALAASAYAQTVDDDDGGQPSTAEDQQDAPRQIEITLQPTIERQIERIAGALEAIEADPHAAADQARSQRDLEAQEGMAKWAEHLFWATVVQIALSVGGLIAIIYSLALNRTATKAAVTAAEAAQKSVNITLDTARKELRAYVGLEKIDAVPGGSEQNGKVVVNVWRLTPIWKNNGHTPARRVVTHVSHKIFNIEEIEGFDFPDLWSEGEKPAIEFVLNPQCGASGSAIDIRVDDILATAASGKRIYIWGWVEYSDVFWPETPPRRTEFCIWQYWIADPRIPNLEHPGNTGHHTFNGADDDCYRQPKPRQP